MTNKKITITKEEFESYEAVRVSGVINMMMISTFQEISGLPRDKIIKIMETYSELADKFPGVRE